MTDDTAPKQTAEAARREKWYRHWRFPLVPVLSVRGEDRHNCADFSFQWMFLRIWSMMSPDIGVEVKMDDQAFHVRFMVPYLIILFELPLFPRGWSQKIWRTKKWTPQESGDKPQQWRTVL